MDRRLLSFGLWIAGVTTAWGQPVPHTAVSLEWRCAASTSIVLGKIDEFREADGQESVKYAPEFVFNVSVDELLKGVPRQRVTFQKKRDRRLVEDLRRWKDSGKTFLLFLDESRNPARLQIDTYSEFVPLEEKLPLHIWSNGRQFTLGRDAYLTHLKKTVSDDARLNPQESFEFRYGRFFSVLMPLDQRLEKLSKDILEGQNPNKKDVLYGGGREGLSAIPALGHFRSEKNVSLIKRMLTDSRNEWIRETPERFPDRIEVTQWYDVRQAAYHALKGMKIEVEKPLISRVVGGPTIAESERATIAKVEEAQGRVTFSAPVGNTIHVRRLELRHLDSISDLSALKHLKEVHIIRLETIDISFLATAKSITEVRLFAASLPTLDVFSELENLRILSVPGSKYSSLAPLSSLRHLSDLDINNSNVADLSPLKNLRNLQSLNLSRTRVSDLGPLRGLEQLRTIFLSKTKVKDIGPLSGMKNLTAVGLEGTGVGDLTSLANKPTLQFLVLNGSRVSKLDPLATCPGLSSIELDYTGVEDVSPLAKLKLLTRISARGSRIKDISPLAALPRLQRLDVSEIPNLQGIDVFPLRHVLVVR